MQRLSQTIYNALRHPNFRYTLYKLVSIFFIGGCSLPTFLIFFNEIGVLQKTKKWTYESSQKKRNEMNIWVSSLILSIKDENTIEARIKG
jgi:hypothetical protein